MIDLIAKIIIGIGAAFGLIGSIGILRMPDVYNRIHAETISVVGGTVVTLLGVVILKGFTIFSLKIILIAVFLFITNPVGSHAIARAAHKSNAEMSPKTKADKLKEEKE